MSDVTVLETEISPEEKALNELHAKIVDLQMIVETIMKMRKEKLFRFLSKKTRNELMISMVEVAADVKDGAQAARDALKKNKRIRVPEELVDALLVENRLAAIVISNTIESTQLNKPDDEDEPETPAPVAAAA